MSEALRDLQQTFGAIFQEEVPVSFGNDALALKAAKEKVALCDRSHWGLLQLTGEDRLSFLHNQTTNNIQRLQPGLGCDTVFVNSTARTLDLATVYATEDSLLVLVSPQRRQFLPSWLDRYLFPMDRVQIKDISDTQAIFTLMGAESDSLLQQLRINIPETQPEGTHQTLEVQGISLRVAVGTGLALPGYTLIVTKEDAAIIWERIIKAGAVPMGDRVWEQLRIQQGRPAPDQELTEDYNPLEAGLLQSISFNKGCYIGQETIARLNTYKGVKQRLWGVQMDSLAPAETPITLQGDKVGTLTSVIKTDSGILGLCYIRTKAGGEGLTVEVGNTQGTIIPVPFLTHDYYSPDNS